MSYRLLISFVCLAAFLLSYPARAQEEFEELFENLQKEVEEILKDEVFEDIQKEAEEILKDEVDATGECVSVWMKLPSQLAALTEECKDTDEHREQWTQYCRVVPGDAEDFAEFECGDDEAQCIAEAGANLKHQAACGCVSSLVTSCGQFARGCSFSGVSLTASEEEECGLTVRMSCEAGKTTSSEECGTGARAVCNNVLAPAVPLYDNIPEKPSEYDCKMSSEGGEDTGSSVRSSSQWIVVVIASIVSLL